MSFYFVRAVSNFGPVNFPVFTDCHNREIFTITAAVNAEAARRGLVLSSDWTAEPIDEFEYRRLAV